MEEKLRLGLDILIRLADIIQEAVYNSPFLATEYGCKGFSEPLNLENASLLISVPSKLEPYPGRTGSNSWMGNNAVRFWKEQRGTQPAAGAAPAAAQEAAPAAEGAAAAAADWGAAPAADAGAAAEGAAAAAADAGAAQAAKGARGGAAAAAGADGGAAVGADGGAATAAAADSASTPRIGKVRSLLLTPTGTENSSAHDVFPASCQLMAS